MKTNSGKFFKCSLSCFLALTICAVTGQQACLTPVQIDGFCIPINDCPFIVEQLKRFGSFAEMPKSLVNFLRRSQCIGNTEAVHICCAADSIGTTTTTTTTTTTSTPLTNSSEISLSARTSLSAEDYRARLNPAGTAILESMKCGFIETNKVSHGNATTLAEFPWMALLRYNTTGNQYQCGGTLITERYILTAAHCVKGISTELIGVRLGEYDLSSEMDCQIKGRRQVCNPPVEDYGIEEVLPHPQYSRVYLRNDVALIKINGSVSFKRHIKPICLPITAPSLRLQEDQEYFISGWGTTENGTTPSILLKAKVPHLSLDVCQNIFKQITLINDLHICAGGQDRVDSCKGDSGGPLFFSATYMRAPRYVQYGVVSFGGTVCGSNHSYPGIYANLIQYMPWITENIV